MVKLLTRFVLLGINTLRGSSPQIQSENIRLLPSQSWKYCVCNNKPVTQFQCAWENSGGSSSGWGMLVIHGFWGRQCHYSLRAWPLIGCVCSRGWPQVQAYMGSIPWTPWDMKKMKHMNLGGRHARGFQKELGRGRWKCIWSKSLYVRVKFS